MDLRQLDADVYEAFKKGILDSHSMIRAPYAFKKTRETEFFGGCIQMLQRWAAEEGIDFDKALEQARASKYAESHEKDERGHGKVHSSLLPAGWQAGYKTGGE